MPIAISLIFVPDKRHIQSALNPIQERYAQDISMISKLFAPDSLETAAVAFICVPAQFFLWYFMISYLYSDNTKLKHTAPNLFNEPFYFSPVTTLYMYVGANLRLLLLLNCINHIGVFFTLIYMQNVEVVYYLKDIWYGRWCHMNMVNMYHNISFQCFVGFMFWSPPKNYTVNPYAYKALKIGQL